MYIVLQFVMGRGSRRLDAPTKTIGAFKSSSELDLTIDKIRPGRAVCASRGAQGRYLSVTVIEIV